MAGAPLPETVGGRDRGVELLSSLTLVLPAHNEAENLGWLIPEASARLAELATEFDVVLVDDGSADGTSTVAEEAAASAGLALTVIRHPGKEGYGAAVGDGLRAARGDFVAFTDADGQFEVGDLALLIPLLAEADLVGGWRAVRQDAAARSVVSGAFNLAVRVVLGLRIRDVDCALKIMRREVLDAVDLEMRSALMNAELYLKARRAGFRIAQAAVPHHARRAGRRSGARPRAVARAIRDLVRMRLRLSRANRHRRLV
ncbi:MAG TPA: glycosyltransferase family 2 protein [Candidatus Dormibacteraeota bacterium]|nr:glycosyltransferase family 2 protein [Candidatus Dormibacteraeota bacterium]